ncbi:response regulator transcription factor [Sediminibacterium soli]|uniref:response regulator transcription factor n=1 Tax=Sediminibacterium soli TaxID=2698829 RepID=UPI00137AF5C7|nr:response regulator transcription factor [Sediminibacterium soli]NCI46515.1 response regulator transcription factor [Sediminibacterium soli]
MTPSRIILADDHQFMLEGVQSILKDDASLEIVATAHNGHQLMDAVAQERPDLVVLDLNMPGYDGLQCLEKIKQQFPRVKVLVLSNYSQPDLVGTVKKMQADGYLVKNSTAAELRDAISMLLSGETHFPATEELKPVSEDSYFFDEFLKKYQLTKREVEVIRLVCREMSTKEIAAELFLSELTVNTHRRNILKKLSLKNVAGLVNFAKQNQIL